MEAEEAVHHRRWRVVLRSCSQRWICPITWPISACMAWRCVDFAYLCIPDKTRGMIFHHILLHIVEDGRECLDPFDMRLIPAQEE